MIKRLFFGIVLFFCSIYFCFAMEGGDDVESREMTLHDFQENRDVLGCMIAFLSFDVFKNIRLVNSYWKEVADMWTEPRELCLKLESNRAHKQREFIEGSGHLFFIVNPNTVLKSFYWLKNVVGLKIIIIRHPYEDPRRIIKMKRERRPRYDLVQNIEDLPHFVIEDVKCKFEGRYNVENLCCHGAVRMRFVDFKQEDNSVLQCNDPEELRFASNYFSQFVQSLDFDSEVDIGNFPNLENLTLRGRIAIDGMMKRPQEPNVVDVVTLISSVSCYDMDFRGSFKNMSVIVCCVPNIMVDKALIRLREHNRDTLRSISFVGRSNVLNDCVFLHFFPQLLVARFHKPMLYRLVDNRFVQFLLFLPLSLVECDVYCDKRDFNRRWVIGRIEKCFRGRPRLQLSVHLVQGHQKSFFSDEDFRRFALLPAESKRGLT